MEQDAGGNDVVVFNAFMVDIDKPGEYDRHCLLTGDDVGMGIWGPFPLWNERNYVPWRDPQGGPQALRGFQELFQAAPDELWIEVNLLTTPARERVVVLDTCYSGSMQSASDRRPLEAIS